MNFRESMKYIEDYSILREVGQESFILIINQKNNNSDSELFRNSDNRLFLLNHPFRIKVFI